MTPDKAKGIVRHLADPLQRIVPTKGCRHFAQIVNKILLDIIFKACSGVMIAK